MKPFKPPSRVKSLDSPASRPQSSEPPAKKRRISENDEDRDVNLEASIATAHIVKKDAPAPKRSIAPSQKFVAPARKPLQEVKGPNGSSQSQAKTTSAAESYYMVTWRKPTNKKNKTWEGDAVLAVVGSYAKLQDVNGGRDLGQGVCKGPFLPGSELRVGGKEIEVDRVISREDYMAGRVFFGKNKDAKKPTLKEINGTKVTIKQQADHDKLALKQKDVLVNTVASSTASKATFKTPLLDNNVLAPSKDPTVHKPRHDPKAEGACVMKRPRSVPKGKQVVDVVVDPNINKFLREHQREGIAFLYECVMGMKDYTGEGAILADEMGLGKTLQTIALLWTLLKQSPIGGEGSVIKKALIVCPVTLINNWRKEFRKWLGAERVGIFTLDDKKDRITDFTKGRMYQVMIIGYEKLTKVKDELQGNNGIDIVIADEGHRLKTAKNKAAAAIKSLNTERRIILSGTPIQNDIEEYYQMVDFVNPSIMSKYSTFKKEFETPIVKSRQPGASAKDIEKGEARLQELMERTGEFILRRTSDIVAKYLPQKTEYIVMCRPTEAQATVYRNIIGSQAFMNAMDTPQRALELITVLKKLCNSPSLLLKQGEKEGSEYLAGISPRLFNRGASAKLQVLDELLFQISSNTDEKVVIVSNYTSTLEVIGAFLSSMQYSFVRLDGQTPNAKRQPMVDQFNASSQKNGFVFLLSTKAGGVGINLIGASRLILFDSDWNPANDLQAMARVHREGQKRATFIYRLLIQGALDEKIFQRQVSKTGLADNIVDKKSTNSGFTQAELRDLFTFDAGEDCQTHRLLGCTCEATGQPVDVSVEDAEEEIKEAVEQKSGEIEVWRLDESDDEDLAPTPVMTFPKMTEIDFDAQEEEIQRRRRECKDSKGKAKMLSLMKYRHFDTANAGKKLAPPIWDDDEDEGEGGGDVSELSVVETAIEDAALRKVVCDEGRRVGFVFAKLSRGASS